MKQKSLLLRHLRRMKQKCWESASEEEYQAEGAGNFTMKNVNLSSRLSMQRVQSVGLCVVCIIGLSVRCAWSGFTSLAFLLGIANLRAMNILCVLNVVSN